MAKTQKYGLSEDAVPWLGRGRGVGEAERGAHSMGGGGGWGWPQALQTCPGALGSSFPVPEVRSRLLYSESPLSPPNISTSSLKFFYQSLLSLSLLEVTGSDNFPQPLSSSSRKRSLFPFETLSFMAFSDNVP